MMLTCITVNADNLDSHSADIDYRPVCPVVPEEEEEEMRRKTVAAMAGPAVSYHIAAAAVGKAPVEAVDRESATKMYIGESRPTPVSAGRIAAAGKAEAVEAVKRTTGSSTAFAVDCMMSSFVTVVVAETVRTMSCPRRNDSIIPASRTYSRMDRLAVVGQAAEKSRSKVEEEVVAVASKKAGIQGEVGLEET